MKKTLFLLIGIVFFAAILVDGMFFTTIFVDVSAVTIKAESLEIFNLNAGHNVVLKLDGESSVSYKIDYEILPLNAKQEVKYMYTVNPDKEHLIEADSDGLVTFYGKISVVMVISTTDGTNLNDTINFYVLV
jgi:hypothetical protein